MKLERIARRHLKPEERLRIAQRCQSSGLSQSEFARRHRISLSSLQRWLTEARNPTKEVPGVAFQEVKIAPSVAEAIPSVWAMEIVGPDGMTVRCRDGLSLEDLTGLLRGRAC